MNKKNLPKAIRPGAAGEAAAMSAAEAPSPAPSPAQSAAQRPAPAAHREPPKVRPSASPVPPPAATQQVTPPETDEAKDRRARALKVVQRSALWSGAAGLIPIPVADLAAVGGVQLNMLRKISQIYGVPFSENRGKALIASIFGAMIPASSGMGVASLIKGVPLAGTAVSAVAMPTLSVGATYAIGRAFIQHFASGGTLLDFSPPDYNEFLKVGTRKGRAATQPI
jgi:uncharacterized protein (DUF697 family)